MKSYEKTIAVRWADVDANRHVRHSAYYDYGADLRIRFFHEVGFGNEKFIELNFGPILFHESCSFIREIHLNETIRINFLKGDVRADGARWTLYHEIYNFNNEKAAHIMVKGAWMDLKKRKLTVPPMEMAKALNQLPKGEDYVYKKKTP